MVQGVILNYKDAFWALFHIMKDWIQLMGPRDEISGLRNYDKYFAAFRQQIDELVTKLPKE